MKNILKFVMIVIAFITFTTNQVEAKSKKVKCVIEASIDCQGCAKKIEKNIAFERGVKAINVDVKKQLVTITYVEGKNTPEDLAKAIAKLGFKTKVQKEKNKTE